VVLGAGTRDDVVEHSFVHKAMLYEGDDEFVDGAVPFLLRALDDGAPTLVVVSPHKIDRLRAELGDVAAQVRFEDMRALGDNPARIIPAWLDFVDEHVGMSPRGIGEPIWPGRDRAELVECQLHEALLNLAFHDAASLELLCPYDVQALSDDVIACAHETHPIVANVEGERASDAYAGMNEARAIFTNSLPPPPAGLDELRFTTGPLHHFRAFVEDQAVRAGLSGTRVGDTVLAANEIASNSLLHGGGAGLVRAWTDDGTFLCEIRDHGQIGDLLVGRRRPSRDDTDGRGVWMANQLCDLVQVRSSEDGTTVRLHMRVDPTRAAR
jgi:anti-sigma regulatory factor (Ser/Thr protein kinase)